MGTTQHAPDDTQDETYTPDWAGQFVRWDFWPPKHSADPRA